MIAPDEIVILRVRMRRGLYQEVHDAARRRYPEETRPLGIAVRDALAAWCLEHHPRDDGLTVDESARIARQLGLPFLETADDREGAEEPDALEQSEPGSADVA